MGLLGGALGHMFGGSPQFLFVFYMPDRRENIRSSRRDGVLKFYLFINTHVFISKKN